MNQLYAFTAQRTDENIKVSSLYEGEEAKQFIDDYCSCCTDATLYHYKNKKEAERNHKYWLNQVQIG